MPTVEESANKQTYRRMLDAANAQDERLMRQTFDEVFHPDVVVRTPLPTETTGVEAMKEVFVALHRGFPDLHVRIDDLLEEGDKVVARQTVTGTNLGEFLGMPPTGKPVTYGEIFIFRFADGRIAETCGVVDALSALRQLDLSQGEQRRSGRVPGAALGESGGPVAPIDPTTSELARWVGTWALDPERTTVTFRTTSLWILPVKGTARALRGDARIGPDGAVRGSLVIDAASFATKNRKRDDHLRSDAILGVAEHPTMVFTAMGGRPAGDGRIEVGGVLTVRGRSQPLTLHVEVEGTDRSAAVSTEVEIDRRSWGVKWPGDTKVGAGVKNEVVIRAHFDRV